MMPPSEQETYKTGAISRRISLLIAPELIAKIYYI